jgi:GNAT superfamily N-acetyltransferase
MRSKAHWGYDAAFMEAAVAELTIPPEVITTAAVYVAEADREVLGVYVLSVEEGHPTLRDLWVEPARIGTGVGSMLWRHMLGVARILGHRTVRVQSDPNAEAFYLKMGARRIGTVPSTVVANRALPLLEIDVP